MQYRDQANTVIDVAKDSIRTLTHVNQTSDLYRTQQVLFNAFLTSALAVLFLAVSHAPAVYAANVREEFYMALDLVRGFSKESWISKRLWKTISVLKEYGPKLGLSASRDAGPNQTRAIQVTGGLDPSRSAALAMAGLAGHNVDDSVLYSGDGQSCSATTGLSTSLTGMADELKSLFEAAGGYQAPGDGDAGECGNPDGSRRASVADDRPPQSTLQLSVGGDDDVGLSSILRDLF